ncbi:MAG: hypothetical protein ACRD4P_12675 [Bryobacteraceae bacterium]
MPDIVIVHVPRIPAEAVQELETALRSVSEDVSSRAEPPGEHAFFELLLPAAFIITVATPLMDGFIKKLGETAAEGVKFALVKAFQASRKVAGHWMKADKTNGPAVTPLSLTFAIGAGSVRLMFPADLDAEQMRQALSQVNDALADGRTAIAHAEELKRGRVALLLEGEYLPDSERLGEDYYDRVYVYRGEASRWVDVYELMQAQFES